MNVEFTWLGKREQRKRQLVHVAQVAYPSNEEADLGGSTTTRFASRDSPLGLPVRRARDQRQHHL